MGEAAEVTVEITPRMYVAHGDLHGALQEGVYRELEDDPPLQDFFDLYRPNRFIPEDADTEMWEDTEDAVYTGSDARDGNGMKGRYALVQFVSCDGKDGYAYDKVESQLEHFERWPENRFDAAEMAGGNTGWYVAAADLSPDEVPMVNAELRAMADDYARELRDELMRESDDPGLVHALGIAPMGAPLETLIPGMEDRYQEEVGALEPPTVAVPVTLQAVERRDLEGIEDAIADAFQSLFDDAPNATDDGTGPDEEIPAR